jgi:hypothetical protein
MAYFDSENCLPSNGQGLSENLSLFSAFHKSRIRAHAPVLVDGGEFGDEEWAMVTVFLQLFRHGFSIQDLPTHLSPETQARSMMEKRKEVIKFFGEMHTPCWYNQEFVHLGNRESSHRAREESPSNLGTLS